MEFLENKLQEIIKTGALFGLKIEFEAQGATLCEVLFLEKLAKEYENQFKEILIDDKKIN